MPLGKIEEIFVPATVDTVEGFIAFMVDEILRRGGDPTKVKMLNTAEVIPNVEFSDEWPCMTFQFDLAAV